MSKDKIKAKEMSKQLSSFSRNLLEKLEDNDFIGKDFSQTANMKAVLKGLNQITNKIKDDVLLAESFKERQSKATFYIKVAKAAIKQGDLATAQTILGTLKSSEIEQLNVLTDEQKKYVANTLDFISKQKSEAYKRDENKKVTELTYKEGTIPPIPMFFTDVVGISENYTNKIIGIENAREAIKKIEVMENFDINNTADPEILAIKALIKLTAIKETGDALLPALKKLAAQDVDALKSTRASKLAPYADFMKKIRDDAKKSEKVEFSDLKSDLEKPSLSGLDVASVHGMLKLNSESELNLLINNNQLEKNTVIFIPFLNENGAVVGVDVKVCNEKGDLIDAQRPIDFIYKPPDDKVSQKVIEINQKLLDELKENYDAAIPKSNVRVLCSTEESKKLLTTITTQAGFKLKNPSQIISDEIKANNGGTTESTHELQNIYLSNHQVQPKNITKEKNVKKNEQKENIALETTSANLLNKKRTKSFAALGKKKIKKSIRGKPQKSSSKFRTRFKSSPANLSANKSAEVEPPVIKNNNTRAQTEQQPKVTQHVQQSDTIHVLAAELNPGNPPLQQDITASSNLSADSSKEKQNKSAWKAAKASQQKSPLPQQTKQQPETTSLDHKKPSKADPLAKPKTVQPQQPIDTSKLTNAQQTKLEDFKKSLQTSLDKQFTAEEKAEAAKPGSYADIYKKDLCTGQNYLVGRSALLVTR